MIIKKNIYTIIFVTYLFSFTVIFLTLFTYFLDFENFGKYTIYVIAIILTLLIIPLLLWSDFIMERSEIKTACYARVTRNNFLCC